MYKEYYIPKTSFWFLAKLLIYGIGVIVSYEHIYIIFFTDFVLSWVAHDTGPIATIQSYRRGIKDILFNSGGVNFVIGIFEDRVTTKDGDSLYDEIKRYEISRGGSKPYLLLNNGKRMDRLKNE